MLRVGIAFALALPPTQLTANGRSYKRLWRLRLSTTE